MTEQNKGLRRTIIMVSIGLILGVSITYWITQGSQLPDALATATSQQNQRLTQLEQAVMALTQALHVSQMKSVSSEPANVATPVDDGASRQGLAQIIRNELRQALANQSPEAQRAREEAIATAEILNTPENKAAYQSATSVVHTAVAAKRWTEEDKETFRTAFVQLTNDQRTELMKVLAPAVNNGEIAVEVNGPLF